MKKEGKEYQITDFFNFLEINEGKYLKHLRYSVLVLVISFCVLVHYDYKPQADVLLKTIILLIFTFLSLEINSYIGYSKEKIKDLFYFKIARTLLQLLSLALSIAVTVMIMLLNGHFLSKLKDEFFTLKLDSLIEAGFDFEKPKNIVLVVIAIWTVFLFILNNIAWKTGEKIKEKESKKPLS